MQKTILVDVDQTLLLYSDPFARWAAERGHACVRRLGEVYVVEEALGCDAATASRLIGEFGSHDAFGALPAMPHAVDVLNDLYDRGWSFVAVTACPQTERVEQLRRRNLEKTFGFGWTTIHYTGIRQSKRAVLDRYEPAIWVEDSFHHAVEGAHAGHRTFLIDHPYNRADHHPDVTRVADWREIREHIQLR